MVLYHVAQLTDLVVIGPATFDTHHFTDRNLHVINAGVIPLTVDKAIGKSQYQQVLYGFLTQVVIDSINRLFIEILGECFVDLD